MVLCHAYPLARERHVHSTNTGPGTWYNDTVEPAWPLPSQNLPVVGPGPVWLPREERAIWLLGRVAPSSEATQRKPEPCSIQTSLAHGGCGGQSIKAEKPQCDIRQGPGSKRAKEIEPGTERGQDPRRRPHLRPWDPRAQSLLPLSSGLPLSSCNCPTA